MRKVFIVNEPMKRDPDTGAMTRKMDFRHAASYGELTQLTPGGNPPHDPYSSIVLMRKRLQNARPSDYLLPVGHPLLIACAAAMMARATGGVLNILLWDRPTMSYIPVKVELWDTPAEILG